MSEKIAALEAKASSLVEADRQARAKTVAAQGQLADLKEQLDAALIAGDHALAGKLYADVRGAEQALEDAEQIIEGIMQRQRETNAELHEARAREELDELDEQISAKGEDLTLASQEAAAAWLSLKQLLADSFAGERALTKMRQARAGMASHLAGETWVPRVVATHPFEAGLSSAAPQLVDAVRMLRLS